MEYSSIIPGIYLSGYIHGISLIYIVCRLPWQRGLHVCREAGIGPFKEYTDITPALYQPASTSGVTTLHFVAGISRVLIL